MAKHRPSRRLLECVENDSLVQVINEPTSEDALQTRKNQTEVWKSKAALATATMKLWSLKSSEKWERQIVQCTVQDPVHTVTAWPFRRANFSLFRDLLGRISCKTTIAGDRKACESWLIKENLLKTQERPFLRAGAQAGLTMDQCERKGNLWLTSNAKQSTWTVEARVGGICRHHLILQGWNQTSQSSAGVETNNGCGGQYEGEKTYFNFFLQNWSYTTETENRSLYNRVLCPLASAIHLFLTNLRENLKNQGF